MGEKVLIMHSKYLQSLEFWAINALPFNTVNYSIVCPKGLSWWNILACNFKSYTFAIMNKKVLTSSVLTISFAMKRRIFNGTDGFPNLPWRNFIQIGRSTGTVPWNLEDMNKNQITSCTHQAYQAKKAQTQTTQVSL